MHASGQLIPDTIISSYFTSYLVVTSESLRQAEGMGTLHRIYMETTWIHSGLNTFIHPNHSRLGGMGKGLWQNKISFPNYLTMSQKAQPKRLDGEV